MRHTLLSYDWYFYPIHWYPIHCYILHYPIYWYPIHCYILHYPIYGTDILYTQLYLILSYIHWYPIHCDILYYPVYTDDILYTVISYTLLSYIHNFVIPICTVAQFVHITKWWHVTWCGMVNIEFGITYYFLLLFTCRNTAYVNRK